MASASKYGYFGCDEYGDAFRNGARAAHNCDYHPVCRYRGYCVVAESHRIEAMNKRRRERRKAYERSMQASKICHDTPYMKYQAKRQAKRRAGE